MAYHAGRFHVMIDSNTSRLENSRSNHALTGRIDVELFYANAILHGIRFQLGRGNRCVLLYSLLLSLLVVGRGNRLGFRHVVDLL